MVFLVYGLLALVALPFIALGWGLYALAKGLFALGKGLIALGKWLKRSLGRRGVHERRDFWLVVATILVVAAGGFTIADSVYSVQSGSFFWHSIAFTDIAAISTAVAAAAACVSAWLMRKPRLDGDAVSDTEAELIREALARRAAEEISPEEFSEMMNALVRLRHASPQEKPTRAPIRVQSDDDLRALEEGVRRVLDDNDELAAREISSPKPPPEAV